MRIVVSMLAPVAIGGFFVACSNTSPGTPTAPSSTVATSPAAAGASGMLHPDSFASAGPSTRQVSMMDACDGPTFNLNVGPGDCTRPGGVSFSTFLAQMQKHQAAGAWHNAPAQTDAKLGDTMIAVNKGGEVHTFTRVAEFGGGIVPVLNQLSGTPNVVPECSAETTFVPPGGTDTETLNQTGELKFQCCIHPWMRTAVMVKSH